MLLLRQIVRKQEGAQVPFFIFRSLAFMDLTQSITQFLEQNLPSEAHFIVNVSVKSLGKERSKIVVLADSNAGITIDECGVLSRKLGKWLEESNAIEGAYTLEVSSPGVDYPLSDPRSFQKNVGRQLLVITQDLQRFEGVLVDVSSTRIRLQPVASKKQKTEPEPIEVQLENIKKATVQIVF